jgi:hypothetical protein
MATILAPRAFYASYGNGLGYFFDNQVKDCNTKYYFRYLALYQTVKSIYCSRET